MAENSQIEWTDHTLNPWLGCTKVGPGCDNCYAEALLDKRLGTVEWGGDRVRTKESTWNAARKWQRNAAAFLAQHGRRQRVFCASLADVFDNKAPREWRADLAQLIRETPDLDWLLLTKRIGLVPDMLAWMFDYSIPDNVRIGATIVNQDEWDRDIAKVAAVSVLIGKSRVFLSMEPLLGAVTLRNPRYRWSGIVGWVIVGGESGREARPMNPLWVRLLRDECADHGVPFLFKQWGEWAKPPSSSKQEGDVMLMNGDGFVRTGSWMRRVGKKAAGRLLDGRTYDGFPA